MNYIAITEVIEAPIYVEPKKFTSEEISEMMANLMFTPIDSFKQEPLKAYTTIKMSEETFKFIESVATISVPFFGEKDYKINNVSFQIHTEEEYEKRYGKSE